MRSTEKTYEIVIAYVKKMIMNRDLLVGEKLPPEREIAEHLQVSRNSVREAIRIMDMTGIISSQQEIILPVIFRRAWWKRCL